MEKYDYREAVCEDIREHNIEVTEENRDEVEIELYDDCFVSDSVTGNASGSYTFNTWQAEENLCHNLDLLGEALSEFGANPAEIEIMESPESCDVTIRCYLLSECISKVLDEIIEENEND